MIFSCQCTNEKKMSVKDFLNLQENVSNSRGSLQLYKLERSDSLLKWSRSKSGHDVLDEIKDEPLQNGTKSANFLDRKLNSLNKKAKAKLTFTDNFTKILLHFAKGNNTFDPSATKTQDITKNLKNMMRTHTDFFIRNGTIYTLNPVIRTRFRNRLIQIIANQHYIAFRKGK
jgi:hypothetical protein